MLTHVIITAGCDQTSRYKVLTFFFEGVPPLDGEAVIDPNSVDTDGGGTASITSNMTAHEPRKNCNECHAAIRERTISAQVKLVTPVPDLCYKCHPDKPAEGRFAHGPAAVGDCTFCHNPHVSKNIHLLKYPVPQMCYKCHDKRVIVSIEKHPEQQLNECLSCHMTHGTVNNLLRRSGEAIDTSGESYKTTDEDIKEETDVER